jgi:two-component system, NtrC family, nitrogen regulation sensor histidine kinase NtrY
LQLQLANPKSKIQDRKLSHEQRILLMSLLAGLPGTLASLLLLWTGEFSTKVQWTLSAFIVLFWVGYGFAVRERVVTPLHTLSNLLAALREEDYSIRARGARFNDALGEVMLEVNALGETLREQRMGAMDAMTLLRTVMAEIDVAVFTFDAEHKLRLVNRAGERLLAVPSERLLGRTASELGLDRCLQADVATTLALSFPGGMGRWAVRRSRFRERGVPHQLLLLADLSSALREEERQAWQRLLRVLGHELNNSLAPIKSIAGSLENLMQREERAPDWEQDLRRGLAVIAGRAEALSRFMQAYAQLARLPQPRLQPVEVSAWIHRVTSLETRLGVELQEGPELTIQADGDQLDQLLINLLRNAVDASLGTGGKVTSGWERKGPQLNVWVKDEGQGLPETPNLFVPFFTTKPGGSGIGLVLSRQIAEAHGGSLTLENRTDQTGCIAHLTLPL